MIGLRLFIELTVLNIRMDLTTMPCYRHGTCKYVTVGCEERGPYKSILSGGPIRKCHINYIIYVIF